MTMRFGVLASGSSGNCSFLHADEFGLLIDAGLGPRQMEQRLAAAGMNWLNIKAVLLSHTHSDHWNERTLARLGALQIPFYCHPEHQRNLQVLSPAFQELAALDLVRSFEPNEPLSLAPCLACLPFHVQHDSTMTCGFRFEAGSDLFGRPVALGYCSDLGTWDSALAQLLADVEVLAVEFNHDINLQRASGRSSRTIARNLGNKGHLSNEQAAALVAEVLRLSETDSLKHIVQLHLSRDCNQPALAVGSLREVLASGGFRLQVHTASQDEAGPFLALGELPQANGALARKARKIRKMKSRTEPTFVQDFLPGWEE